MNAWANIAMLREADVEPDGSRRRLRLRLLAALALVPTGCAALAIATLGSPSAQAISTGRASAAVVAPLPPAAPTSTMGDAAAEEPGSVRFTGKVGQDLTRSLQGVGVPEAQGRQYIAALATAIRLQGGLSVDDKFDLVILKGGDGALGEVAFAGLDRIGRSDVELMKWTDGREVRWLDADGMNGEEGMEMPVSGRVTSGFGSRFHPILHHMRMHKGVDLAAAYGTPILAAASGRVVAAGWHGGYGRQVAIQHGGGLETTYSHMSSIAASPGSHVRQGQVIGYVGSSGLATGPHLHYEVYKDGRLVNPLSVKMVESPLKGEELHAFQSRLRGLLTAGNGA